MGAIELEAHEGQELQQAERRHCRGGNRWNKSSEVCSWALMLRDSFMSWKESRVEVGHSEEKKVEGLEVDCEEP